MRYLFFISFLSLSLFASNADALYSSCKFCHGFKGEKVYADIVPSINSLDLKTLELKLKLYKQGKVDEYGYGEIMRQQMQNIPDVRISQLAKYIKSLKEEDK